MNVAEALEDLYASEPSEFTKKRDAIAKELKKAGDKEGAATIAAKRKPTQIAYVLNQLARKHPDAIAELVDVGRELVREQRRAIRGEASHGLRDSIDRQRKAIHEVGQKASLVMKALGVDPMAHLQEVSMALQAALVDPAIGAALEAGQLEKAPEAAVGFGGPMAAAPTAAESEPAPRPARRADPKPEPEYDEPDEEEDDEEEKRRAKEHAEKERARAAHAKSVAEAKAVLAAAASELEAARTAAADAATEAEAAELVLAKAREAATAAAKESKRLGAELTRAERTHAAAEKAVAHLESEAP